MNAFWRALTNLGRVRPPGHVLGSHGLLDAVHLLLVALAVPHGVLLGLFQRALQGLDALRGGAQPLLQLGQLTAQVRVVPDQLQGRTEGKLLRRLSCFLARRSERPAGRKALAAETTTLLGRH